MGRPSIATFHHNRPETAANAFHGHLADGIAHVEGPLSNVIRNYSAGLPRAEMAQAAPSYDSKPSMV